MPGQIETSKSKLQTAKQIPITKFQNPNNKSQINSNNQKFNDPNRFGILKVGYCDLFVIWILFFGICFEV